jgi:lipopolysaccharide/colanic/teichoic acid biosynthesis glycosyltransferase
MPASSDVVRLAADGSIMVMQISRWSLQSHGNPRIAIGRDASGVSSTLGQPLGEVELNRMPQDSRTDQSAFVSKSLWARRLKRPFDVIAALVLILATAPILVLAAVLVKLTSRGPLLFSQVRTGRHGQPIRPYKFRSMSGTRKPDPLEMVSLDHPEITSVGRVIRRLKIDELPQLFSVLAGTMSLIGPRPTLPDQTERYDDFQWRRQLVRPGITGLAQVNSSASRSWDERIRYDVHYVQHHDFRMDAGILAKSVLVALLGEERFARPFEESPYARKANESEPADASPQQP